MQYYWLSSPYVLSAVSYRDLLTLPYKYFLCLFLFCYYHCGLLMLSYFQVIFILSLNSFPSVFASLTYVLFSIQVQVLQAESTTH